MLWSCQCIYGASLCYSSGAVAVASPFSHFPLHMVHTENVDEASEVLKQPDESEVEKPTNFIHCVQVLFEFLPLHVSSVEGISADRSALSDHAAWSGLLS